MYARRKHFHRNQTLDGTHGKKTTADPGYEDYLSVIDSKYVDATIRNILRGAHVQN